MVWWDDGAIATGKVAGVDGMFLAGLINVAPENVTSVAEADGVAHENVADEKSFTDVYGFPAPESYSELLAGAKVPELEALPAEAGKKVAQLALMIDAFALQHGIMSDNDTDM